MQDRLQPSSLAKSTIYQGYKIGKTTKATKSNINKNTLRLFKQDNQSIKTF
jgi:hypothetical protein